MLLHLFCDLPIRHCGQLVRHERRRLQTGVVAVVNRAVVCPVRELLCDCLRTAKKPTADSSLVYICLRSGAENELRHLQTTRLRCKIVLKANDLGDLVALSCTFTDKTEVAALPLMMVCCCFFFFLNCVLFAFFLLFMLKFLTISFRLLFIFFSIPLNAGKVTIVCSHVKMSRAFGSSGTQTLTRAFFFVLTISEVCWSDLPIYHGSSK